MRVLVATDAWHPQVNGVVRTYERLAEEARKLNHEILFLEPGAFRTLPCPTYPEIRLALIGPRAVRKQIADCQPDHIHIATEGPIGFMTRRFCLRQKRHFTTSFHTRFPEYLAARFPVKKAWCYALQRWFHNAGVGTMVATESLAHELKERGFNPLLPWSRGVDIELFRPRNVRLFGRDGPVFLYVGRVAIEKNIEAFLRLDLPGKKVVVGDGPQRKALMAKYPDAIFTGPKQGVELADHYASADVFVFPSMTDTYGIVLLEALASGLPIAALPVTGPKDIVRPGETGILDEDLGSAARAAQKLDPNHCRRQAETYSWAKCANQFFDNIASVYKGADANVPRATELAGLT